jgi:hypothetical protein
MGKFDNMGILSVDFKTKDNNGEDVEFKFKPLPFAYYPEIYDLTQSLSNAGLLDGKDDKDFMSSLDKNLMGKLINVEKIMVKNSYPEDDESKIEEFVVGNTFELIEPLMSLISRQETANPRRVEKAKNELSS